MEFCIHHRIYLMNALLIFSSFFPGFGSAKSTIKSGQFIRDPETLTSSSHSVFTLGFFTPRNSTNRYVGIWYINESYVYWIANRNQPLKDRSGSVTIADDGNLVILNGQNQVIWTTNVSKITGNTTAQLQESGNLVLLDDSTEETIWESFKHPSHAGVPGMRISQNRITGEKIQFTSWKSTSDPSVGYFSASLERLNAPELYIFKGSQPLWRSGPWIGHLSIGLMNMSSRYFGWYLGYDSDGTVYLSYSSSSASSTPMLALSPQGQLVLLYFAYNEETFRNTFQMTECDEYGVCGPYGSCNLQSSPICSCLDGYEPKKLEEWDNKNWTSGCVRKTPLQCERQRNGSGNVEPDGFLRLPSMKVPDFGERSDVEEDKCEPECLRNCSCVAYAYAAGIGCMYWTGDLLDSQKFSLRGADLFLRLASSELAMHTESGNKKNIKLVIGIVVGIGAIALAACVYLLWKLSAKSRGKKKTEIQSQRIIGDQEQIKLEELPLFDLIKLAIATNDFDSTNILGRGGFGPVYKGKLEDGQEIAVKRLSRASGQGVEEFMNEVLVISKLQHRNLVRLLGCCIEEDEKMLIYEFMPNKSLDAFLFDPIRRKSLDWKKRFNIIEGIARGLLYLHRDSRLKIIHRDLKASNILLDGEMIPKISDFGLARIFRSTEDEANTRRVVGTYGYMAPEYAMEGLFSDKSDVYSFGVLLLEVVNGRRNTSFYNNEQSHNLLGLAWKLWIKGDIISLIDPEISDSGFESNILRCIHIGLLCVQEHAKDRPVMSTIVLMLTSEIVNLPPPRQVAFVLRHNLSSSESSSKENKKNASNNVTITEIQGR